MPAEVYIQTSAPTCRVGDFWLDTSTFPGILKVCVGPSAFSNGLGSLPGNVLTPGLTNGVPLLLYAKTGIQANATGNQIADLYTLPANVLATARGLRITAWGLSAANANTKAMTINVGGTGALNAAPTGGTALPAAISSAANPAHFEARAQVLKTGASAQTLLGRGQVEATVSTVVTATATLTDTAAIQINLLINCTTAASDITAAWMIELIP